MIAIGGMCYITYLIHYPMVYLLQRFTHKLEFGLSFASDMIVQEIISVIIILSVSAIAFVFIEKPFMYSDWPNKFIEHFRKGLKIKDVSK